MEFAREQVAPLLRTKPSLARPVTCWATGPPPPTASCSPGFGLTSTSTRRADGRTMIATPRTNAWSERGADQTHANGRAA